MLLGKKRKKNVPLVNDEIEIQWVLNRNKETEGEREEKKRRKFYYSSHLFLFLYHR